MLAVVFVHYDLPYQRAVDHCKWNAIVYGDAQVIAIVRDGIVSPPYPKPGLRNWIPYPHKMETFSLSATKNFGIEIAIRIGYDRIAATDADIAWTPEAIEACQNVGDKEAIVPIYRMAQTFETRHEVSHPDHGCGGTVCMTAENWKRAMYDERYVGYGGEDGRLRRDIAKLGIEERRETIVYHIAHDPTVSQVNVPGAGRADCWNRDTINPDNWAANRKLIDK